MNVTKKALQSTFLKKTLLDTKYFQFLKIKLEYVLLIPMVGGSGQKWCLFFFSC